MAGGVCKFVPIELTAAGKWELDMKKLEASINSKTRILLLNTPHNPTGKVFTQAELESVAEIVKRHPDVTVVLDEVYEKLVYDNHKHIRFASLPGMWERSLTVSSCGKTFSCTGWKVGWVYGGEKLIKPVMLANQWVQYSVSTPTQKAVADIIQMAEKPYENSPSYYEHVRQSYEKKRNYLVESMIEGNIKPYIPDGGFFIMGDISKHTVPEKYTQQPGPSGEVPVNRDWGFARY